MLHCRLRRIAAANDAWNIFHVLMYWDSVVSFHTATRLSVRLTYVITNLPACCCDLVFRTENIRNPSNCNTLYA